MLVSALQFAPVRADVAYNMRRLRQLAGECSFDLLVLPELAHTGYFFTDRLELLELAEEPSTGPFCSWLRTLAAERDGVVISGFAERDGDGRLYNSALIALPDGTWHVYRKTHLFYKEKQIFEAGETGFFVVEWKECRIGTMICYDWRFPESTRTLALRGADVIAHPSNLVAAASLWGPTMATRALENKVITITANRCGTDALDGETLGFSGESRIIAMNGRTLAVAGAEEECVIAAEVDPKATRKKSFSDFNDILADRRPEHYAC